MEKVLKKYTTIPDYLYVKRKADTELEKIIDEMERPGYVLVARQMGKTNLLFYAKRNLKRDDRLLVYVDLSNFFKLERDCYRNIVDSIIEPNENIFESIEEEIYNIRKQDLPANKEYLKSLRVILKYFQGDLVIILDEIDALRSADYSDQIFAQIRSTYFLRTNYPMYERLTYILSGVIEPKDLIRDRNKSPFNIGEKIYLNDFSLDEHNVFIKNSKLQISKDNSDYIFSWTKGNPRLTFDICSEIENHIILGSSINKSLINELIKEKYLTNFDIPPIDHIRELVKSNKLVRDAIVNIQKGFNDISDEMKQKLYLYGVINSDFDKKTVIKNKLISDSLSLRWMDSIEHQNKLTFSYAVSQYEHKEFNNAIDVFKHLLETESPKKAELDRIYYYLGRIHYDLKKLDDAINYLSFDFEDNNLKRKALSVLGRCFLERNLVTKALEVFENIVDDEIDDLVYYYSLLNLIANSSKEDLKKNLELSQKLFLSVSDSRKLNRNELNQFKTLSLYYQYIVYKDMDKTLEAISIFSEVEKYANESDYLAFIFLEYEEAKNEELKKKLVDNIINNKIIFDSTMYEYPITFNQVSLLKYMNFIFDYSEPELFERLLKYAEEYLLGKNENKFEIIYELSRIYDKKQVDYLNYILKYEKDINNTLLLKVFRDSGLTINNKEIEFLKYFDEYLEIFKKEKIQLIAKDILFFALAISEMSRRKQYTKGLELCSIIEEKVQHLEDENLVFESLIIYYWYASLYFNMNNNDKKVLSNREKILYYCEKTLNIIETFNRQKTSIIDETGLEVISEQMNNIKDFYKKRTPTIKNNYKYGRNEVVKVEYNNGNIKEGKYKKFVADILSERCKIIE